MSDPRVLRDRERALEEQFFAKQNEDLKERLRAKQERAAAREELRTVLSIRDDKVLDQLLELGISPVTWAAISLVPLVEVAWANGKVEAAERKAILDAALSHGVRPDGPGIELLKGWLDRRPGPELMQAWSNYTSALCSDLDEASRIALRDEVMDRCRKVAESAGGLLGLGNKVSDEEKKALAQLGLAFGN